MVNARTSLDKVVVTADSEGVVSHAGSALLVGLAEKVGLTAALSAAMEPHVSACRRMTLGSCCATWR